jgi:Domain of unknown function (DUF5666)
MKRLILSAAIVAALAATTAIAQEKPQDPAQQPEARQSSSQSQAAATSVKGTVSSVDQSGKSFVVKDDATGKEVTVYWDSTTKLSGDLKPGSMVSVTTTDQGGKMMATSIDAKGAKKPY